MVVSATGELPLLDGQGWRVVCHIIVAMRNSKRKRVRCGKHLLGALAQAAGGLSERLKRQLVSTPCGKNITPPQSLICDGAFATIQGFCPLHLVRRSIF
jgi:hypothetical protein